MLKLELRQKLRSSHTDRIRLNVGFEELGLYVIEVLKVLKSP